MSSASIPPPHTKSPGSKRSSGSTRHTLFLPMLIFLVGAGSLAFYQVLTLTEQLEQLTQTGERLDNKVKRAQYEKTKFFHIARDILALADKNPNADIVATKFKLRKLADARPELMNAGAPVSGFELNTLETSPAASTNGAPVKPVPPATNAAPVKTQVAPPQ